MMGQNHSFELTSSPSKIPVKSSLQFIRTGAASRALISCIQDRQWLKKSAQLLFERTLFFTYLFSHICTECSETKVTQSSLTCNLRVQR